MLPTARSPIATKQDIYVPDEKSELVPWGLCLHNDSPSLAGRVDPSRLRCLHPRVSLEDCRRLRIPSVSQVIYCKLYMYTLKYVISQSLFFVQIKNVRMENSLRTAVA